MFKAQVTLVAFLVLVTSQGIDSALTCNGTTISKRGCFDGPRSVQGDVFGELIHRDPNVDNRFYGRFLERLLCTCIEILKKKHRASGVKNAYRQLALRNEKECWSLEKTDFTLGSLRYLPDSFCIGEDKIYCAPGPSDRCIGNRGTQFVYKVDFPLTPEEQGLLDGRCHRETIVECPSTTRTVQATATP